MSRKVGRRYGQCYTDSTDAYHRTYADEQPQPPPEPQLTLAQLAIERAKK